MVSDKNRALFEFLTVFEIVNIGLSVVTNLLLIYLIVYRSSKEIGAYRFMLIAFAINDIYFPVLHFLTLPVICSYKDAFIMFAHGILTSKFSICLFGSSFSQTMPLLSHLFANMYVSYGTDSETREYMQPFFDEEFAGEHYDFIGVLYYSTNGAFRPSAFFATMGFNTIMTFCMSIIVGCSIAIVKHLR
ncbi:hypothetical protein PFISCL1PPCAC_12623, partial [Pristionchus fissidentatus]